MQNDRKKAEAEFWQMARRAEVLELTYAAAREAEVAREATVLVAALAMNHVQSGSYLS